jgi:hypothetical protein
LRSPRPAAARLRRDPEDSRQRRGQEALVDFVERRLWIEFGEALGMRPFR